LEFRRLIIIITLVASTFGIMSFTGNLDKAIAATAFFFTNYSNPTWTQVGGEVTENSLFFPGEVHFNNAADGGGVSENRVLKHLPAALPSGSWMADFDYNFTASSIPAAYPLALTTSRADPEQQGPKGSSILVYHGNNSDILHLRVWLGSTVEDSPSLSTGIAISPNTQYYVRLAKTSTELTLSVFSDPARTNQIPGSPINLAIAPTDLNNLKFVQHAASLSSGPARSLTANVDNLNIYVP
jgi:hypothetical protein